MSELIQVDFKRGIITGRQDLEKEPEIIPWVAKKDPEFKDWVKGIALLAESAVKFGGDWRRMAIVLQDKPLNQEPFCMTMWDNSRISGTEVIEALTTAIEKVKADPDEITKIDPGSLPSVEEDPDDQ